MSITTVQVRKIRTEFVKLKPVKETVFALAPILERMRKRGFDIQEIAERLHVKDIEVKPPTLAKYLNEFRHRKDRKAETPSPPAKVTPASQQQEKQPQTDAVKLKATAGVWNHSRHESPAPSSSGRTLPEMNCKTRLRQAGA